MRRDQVLGTKLPQISAQIKAWEQKALAAEKSKDMTAWDDARRNIRRLRAERTDLLRQYH